LIDIDDTDITTSIVSTYVDLFSEFNERIFLVQETYRDKNCVSLIYFTCLRFLSGFRRGKKKIVRRLITDFCHYPYYAPGIRKEINYSSTILEYWESIFHYIAP